MIIEIHMNEEFIAVDTDDGNFDTPIGTKIPVFRDGGPRDGERVATATFKGRTKDGAPKLLVEAL